MIFPERNHFVVLYQENNQSIWLIDAGNVDEIIQWFNSEDKRIAGVFITHAHFDHISGIDELREVLSLSFKRQEATKDYAAKLMFDMDDAGYDRTLEEFETQFPFKVGDIVLITGAKSPNEIIALELCMNRLCYKLNNGLHYDSETLTIYKEMKEERNITLTLDKAKEWYNKGGELREIALQAFNEKELTKVDLPKTWEEFCKNHPMKEGESYVGACSEIHTMSVAEDSRDIEMDRNVCPSKQSAEAHLAMIQLEQLRDCYRGLFVTVIGMPVWCIIRHNGRLVISPRTWGMNETFLSFQSKEVAEEYLKNFKPLIEKAGDLI